MIPNATVKATNIETNTTTTTTSNESGLYTLPFLPIGKYQISVTATGLKTSLRDNIELRVGDRIQLDFKMEVGAVSETVTVSSTAPLLETATASRGQVIDEEKVRDLPLLGRTPFCSRRWLPAYSSHLRKGAFHFARSTTAGWMPSRSTADGNARTNF